MLIKRREFLARGIQAGTRLLLAIPFCGKTLKVNQSAPPEIEFEEPLSPPPLDVSSLARFVDPLPIPATAQTVGYRSHPADPSRKVPYYRIEMRQFLAKVHRDLRAARMWGYQSSSQGPTFDVRSGQDFFVEWVNQLPTHHLFAVDHQIHGAEAKVPMVRTVVHVHGARVTPENDGYPESWYTAGQSRVFYYPNQQDAATLWYHDHALGITRLNVFAGLFGAFLIRDKIEDELGLPKDRYEIPLVICDRSFDRGGQLNYPVGPMFGHPWVPEFSGNAILINGRLFPYLEVEPRRYRFRVVNVSNGRTFRLSLSGHAFHQIGGDQGLLDAPVELSSLVLAPAERADLVLDFSGIRGKQVTLLNEDEEIMQFRVAALEPKETSALPTRLHTVKKLASSSAIKTRKLTLDEELDPTGRVIRSLLNGARWSAPTTETPVLGTTEIWELINTTQDAHPIHLHATRFQVLDRRAFDVNVRKKTRVTKYTAPAKPPEPNESGWKDIVRVDPGTVTRIIVRFDGFPGRYSWHCHILEHEDNEMMRPLEILAAHPDGHRHGIRR